MKITIAAHGKTVYLDTGVSLLPEQWDADKERVRNHPKKEILQSLISKQRLKVEEAAYTLRMNGELHGLSAPQIKEKVLDVLEPERKARRMRLIPLMERYAETCKAEGTRRNYLYTVRRIREYDRHADTREFTDITREWLSSFDRWLARTSPSANARNILLRNIRTVFNRAIDDGLTTAYPFRAFKIRPEPTVSRALTAEQVSALLSVPLSGSLAELRDIWELSFLLAGTNICDLAALRRTDVSGDRVSFRRLKTGQPVELPICPRAKEIIERHKGSGGTCLLDISERYTDSLDYTRRMDRRLKKIPGFPRLSSYWARYSFASIAAACGFGQDVIGRCLGHAPKGVTSVYIRIDWAGHIDSCCAAVRRAVYGQE